MTEEEKKIEVQIKKYAGILPKAIDIDQTTVEFLRENFYKHPTLALTYYHCCSIDPRASTRLIRSIRLSDSLSNTF